jgi:hypothetical protein
MSKLSHKRRKHSLSSKRTKNKKTGRTMKIIKSKSMSKTKTRQVRGVKRTRGGALLDPRLKSKLATTIAKIIKQTVNILDRVIDPNIDSPVTSTNRPVLYELVLSPPAQSIYAKATLPLWSNYFTNDKAFLLDTQMLLADKHEFMPFELQTDMSQVWHDISNETGFCEKYQYVEYKKLAFLNRNYKFLLFMTFYNMTSPALSLMVPIIFLLLPFLILKGQDQPKLHRYILRCF